MKKSVWWIIALAVIFAILTPVGTNQRVFFASSNLVQYLGTFPNNVYESWALKLFGAKLHMYFYYTMSLLFSDFFDKINFESVSKIINVIVIFGTAILARIVGPKEWRNQISTSMWILITTTPLLLHSYKTSLEIEEMACWWALLGFSLSNNSQLRAWAALPIVCLFWLKGATLALAAPIGVMLLTFKYPEKIKMFLFWGLALASSVMIVYLVFPRELIDIQTAPLVQASTHMSLLGRIRGFYQLFQHAENIPSVTSGIVCLIVMLSAANQTMISDTLKVIAGWMGAFICVGAQAKFFPPHFGVVTFASVMTFLFFSIHFETIIQNLKHSSKQKLGMLLVAYCILFLFFLRFEKPNTIATAIGLFGLCAYIIKSKLISKSIVLGIIALPTIFVWANTSSPIGKYWAFRAESQSEVKEYQEFNSHIELSPTPRVLLLDDGYTPYFLNINSACRYFFPLPLQRIKLNSQLPETAVYQEMLNCALGFNDKYIIHQVNWFPLERFESLRQKIENEYYVKFEKEVYAGSLIRLYERKQ